MATEDEPTLEELEEENRRLKMEVYQRENAELRKKLDGGNSPSETAATPAPPQPSPVPAEPAPASSLPVEGEQQPPVEHSPWMRAKKPALLILLIFVLPVLMAAGIVFVIKPLVSGAGTPDTPKTGEIRLKNNGLVVFPGQKIETANSEQKALASGDKATSPPAFIFGNGHTATKKVDLYVDFGSQISRDFILLNSSALEAAVESGYIELSIHAVTSGSIFSVYGPEALAEAAYLDNTKSWDYMIESLKMSAEAQDKGWKAEKIAKELGKTAESLGINEIDRESIQNGTFVSWLLSIGSDPNLIKVGTPGVVINGVPMDTTGRNLNDPDVLQEIIGAPQ